MYNYMYILMCMGFLLCVSELYHYYFLSFLISLFAHIGYNPIEQHNILTIHVNYIKNNILKKKKKKRYALLASSHLKSCICISVILTHL